MPRFVLLSFGVLVGAALTTQAGVNAQLRQFVGSPFRAALINFAVGALAITCLALLTQSQPAARHSSWWMWVGGLLGATYVVGSVVLAPRLGATVLTTTLVAGQLLAALIIDQFGLVGYRVVPITWPRIVGVALLFLGALLVQRR